VSNRGRTAVETENTTSLTQVNRYAFDTFVARARVLTILSHGWGVQFARRSLGVQRKQQLVPLCTICSLQPISGSPSDKIFQSHWAMRVFELFSLPQPAGVIYLVAEAYPLGSSFLNQFTETALWDNFKSQRALLFMNSSLHFVALQSHGIWPRHVLRRSFKFQVSLCRLCFGSQI
jgi:hypothetical protein